MILMVDNYDSFTYNLVQYLVELGGEVEVIRNNECDLAEVKKMAPTHLVISPGPCSPLEAGICVPLIRAFAGAVPILGVCLGHQCIAAAFGADVKPAVRAMHGKTSPVIHFGQGVFEGLPQSFNVARYHSLIADQGSLPECLEMTAWATVDDGSAADGVREVMGLRHKTLPIEGVQFHPEAIMSEYGHALLQNFLRYPEARWT
jgi:anthranilate synthase component II